MKSWITILFLLCCVAAFPQQSITGTVVQEEGGQPVAGVSIFINNTSIGTTTNSDGTFQLNNIPAGKYDLVVSCMGYASIVYALQPEAQPLKVRFALRRKITMLENVTVGGYITETWAKWGKAFLEAFLGVTPVARQCVLLNKEVVHFRFYKKQNRLEAVADAPLKIENPLLGYHLQYDLQDFRIQFNEHSYYYAGLAFFTDRKNAAKKSVKARRARTYYGSCMHFMRALYTGKLNEEGFLIRRMTRVYNTEKERVRTQFKKEIRLGTDITQSSKSGDPNDSSRYYKTIMQQKDYEDVYAANTINADSVFAGKQGINHLVFWNNFLVVTYLKAVEAPEYLEYIAEYRKPIPQFSLLQLPLQEPLLIDANGNWSPPDNILSLGYWSWSDKVGTMLPLDYAP